MTLNALIFYLLSVDVPRQVESDVVRDRGGDPEQLLAGDRQQGGEREHVVTTVPRPAPGRGQEHCVGCQRWRHLQVVSHNELYAVLDPVHTGVVARQLYLVRVYVYGDHYKTKLQIIQIVFTI